MSTGSTAIPLLKAAPDAGQIAERLGDETWRGLEIALMPAHVADDAAVRTAIETVRTATEGRDLVLTAEAPVSWPSGAFVRVDRLTDEARACIVRSADFAAAIGSPVLTIHLYAPLSPEEFRSAPPPDDDAIQQFLRFYALTCLDRGVTPLIENVPPVLRMRVGGLFLSQVGGHWRDLRRWHARVPGASLHVRHVARRALPDVRDRVRIALRRRGRRGARARDLRGGARAGARDGARLGRPRPARRRACRSAAASSSSTRSCGASARSASSSSRRSTSPTRRARRT